MKRWSETYEKRVWWPGGKPTWRRRGPKLLTYPKRGKGPSTYALRVVTGARGKCSVQEKYLGSDCKMPRTRRWARI